MSLVAIVGRPNVGKSYLGDYNYIDVQYMTTWAYRVTLGDGRKLVFYLAEDTEGYGYLVQLSDAEYARYADIVDYTYADDSLSLIHI